MKLLLISDTHLGPGRASVLVDAIGPWLDDVDAIVHAGDITDLSVIAALGAHAPVHAVLGNNDHGLELPEQLVFDADGCEVAVVHDSGAAAGRAARLRRWFPTADLVVFGHSHLPWHETDIDQRDHVQHHVNPGSAMQRRRAPHRTVATVELIGGAVLGVGHHVPSPRA